MMWKTHLLFAVFVGLFFISFFEVSYALFFSLLLIGALAPDIDCSDSKFGRKLKPFSSFIEFFIGHRGVFHSFVALVVIFGVLYVFFGLNVAMPFVLGYFSHIVADMLTAEGVSFFWPLKGRINGFMHTGSFLEKIFLVFLALADLYVLIYIL